MENKYTDPLKDNIWLYAKNKMVPHSEKDQTYILRAVKIRRAPEIVNHWQNFLQLIMVKVLKNTN